MKPAFVIGNGTSRRVLNLEDLKKHGTTYGCNALYRDFHPDVLIATDPGISGEIESSGYPLKHIFYTRKPAANSGSRKIEHHYGFSSGPIALKYAAEAGNQIIYFLGFDLKGKNGLHNNVYSDTPNYKSSQDSETFFGNWINQIQTIMMEHKNTLFVRLVDDDGLIPYKWQVQQNYRTQLLSDFQANINSKPWLKPNELVTDIR